jgi:hypothetical protein
MLERKSDLAQIGPFRHETGALELGVLVPQDLIKQCALGRDPLRSVLSVPISR